MPFPPIAKSNDFVILSEACRAEESSHRFAAQQTVNA